MEKEGHTINVKIDNRIYGKVIHSEEEEASIRKAVSELNEILDVLSKSYKASAVDIVSIAALNVLIDKIDKEKELTGQLKEYERLSDNLQKYVDSLK